MNFSTRLDQIFVLLQHWIEGFFPHWLQPAVGAVVAVIAIVATFPGIFAVTTVLERKGLGRIQNRLGPNRVGPLGILQPVADGIKSLTKEDIVPRSADAVVHFLAPVVLVVAIFLGYAVLPVGRNMVLMNMDAGLLFFFAIGASTELSIFMAGWSSRNKYSLLGALRAVAQMISYEVPLLLSSVVAVMITGSLSTVKIVEAQSGFTGIFPHWYVSRPGDSRASCCLSLPRWLKPTARHSICLRASQNWSPAISLNTQASNSHSSSWASISACFQLPASRSRCFLVDGAHRFPSWASCLPGRGSS